MKGLVFHGKKDIRYEDVPDPKITHPTQVKIRPRFCGICGSDLHEYEEGPILFQCPNNAISGQPYTQCMGHEMCGEIVEIGPAVTELKVGDQVVVEATGLCIDKRLLERPDQQVCDPCQQGKTNCCSNLTFLGLGMLHGGFADYCLVDQYHCIKYDPNVVPNDIAALVEPLLVAWHGAQVAGVTPEMLVLVLGAGPIGLCMVLVLKAMGVTEIVVCEPAKGRRDLASLFGAQCADPTVAAPDFIRNLSPNSRGYDRIYDCLGIPATFRTMIKELRVGGVGTNIAIWPHHPVEFYPMDVTLTEKLITGSMCYVKSDFEQVVEAISRGDIDPAHVRQLVTRVVPLQDGVNEGFDELLRNRATHIKVLIAANR